MTLVGLEPCDSKLRARIFNHETTSAPLIISLVKIPILYEHCTYQICMEHSSYQECMLLWQLHHDPGEGESSYKAMMVMCDSDLEKIEAKGQLRVNYPCNSGSYFVYSFHDGNLHFYDALVTGMYNGNEITGIQSPKVKIFSMCV